jgi:hypothetical protein
VRCASSDGLADANSSTENPNRTLRTHSTHKTRTNTQKRLASGSPLKSLVTEKNRRRRLLKDLCCCFPLSRFGFLIVVSTYAPVLHEPDQVRVMGMMKQFILARTTSAVVVAAGGGGGGGGGVVEDAVPSGGGGGGGQNSGARL